MDVVPYLSAVILISTIATIFLAVLSYAAFKDHCSLFPGTGRMQEELGDEIAPYMSGKGTIRFTVDAPLPPELVEKVVRSRLAALTDR